MHKKPEEWHQAARARGENVLALFERDCVRLAKERADDETRRVLFCFLSDPYQPLESELHLTRRGISVAARHGIKVDILTKGDSALIEQDLPLMLESQTHLGITLSFINDHSNASAYGWGSLSTGYLYGTGTLDGTKNERGIGVCKAMYQDYPKPMSPLYVEDIFIGLKSVTLNPIPADGVARMYVIAMKEETREDEEGPYQVMVETTDTIAKLTATREDFVADGTPGTSSYSSTGAYQNYDVVFTQKEVDDFGMEMAVPFTIDQPFRVKIVGLDEEGVDFGVQRSVGITAEEAWTSEGVFQIYYPDIDKTYNHYYSNSGLPFGFTAMFDAVEIATSLSSDDQIFENTNYLKVSNDGTQCYVAAGDAALPGVYVYTAQPWTNEDMSEEYYYAEDVPEWILSLNVDISNYDDYNLNIVNATCEPLPEGVTGRYAELYIQGRGVKSVDPIYVIQGEVEITGINAVKNESKAVNAATFNMAGQQVNKDFKGLVIKNGKKFMNK